MLLAFLDIKLDTTPFFLYSFEGNIDIAFKRIKKKRRSVQFDVKKGEKHLRVQFLDYRELEQLITLQKIWGEENDNNDAGTMIR